MRPPLAFSLPHQPELPSLRLEVDGVDVPERAPDGRLQWRYDATSNRVTPAPGLALQLGSMIRVRYSISCALDLSQIRRHE